MRSESLNGRSSILAECARIASTQYGVISRAQALEAGLSRFALHRLAESERWGCVHPNVYQLWSPPTKDLVWRQRLMAGTLWLGNGSATSHRAASAVWDLEGADAHVLEISTTTRHRSTSDDLLIHHVRSLPRSEIARRDGIPVTSIARTLLDLAAVLELASLELALESALRRRLTTPQRIARQLERSGSTRKGRSVLHALLEGWRVPTESALETLVWRALLSNGLPRPTRQFEIRGETGALVARVDFAYPRERLAIEADGYRFHSRPTDWRRDRARQNALTKMGWITYRVTWEDATHRPRQFCEDVASLLAVRSGEA